MTASFQYQDSEQGQAKKDLVNYLSAFLKLGRPCPGKSGIVPQLSVIKM